MGSEYFIPMHDALQAGRVTDNSWEDYLIVLLYPVFCTLCPS